MAASLSAGDSTALTLLAACATTGASIGLHSMGAARYSMRSALMNAVTSVTLALVGAAVWGIYGTVLLAAVGSFIGVAVTWYFFVKAMQESGRVPVPRRMAMSMGGRRAAERSATARSATGRLRRRPATTASETPLPQGNFRGDS